MPKVTFATQAEWRGSVAEPLPARLAPLPEWWKKMAARVAPKPGHFQIGTAKVCAPFYDALTAGYVIPLPVPLSVAWEEDGFPVFAWRPSIAIRPVMPDHGAEQLPAGVDENGIIFKFATPWMIRTPKGYSSLFIPPLNRPDLPYEIFAGIVETDVYSPTVHFPFRWRGPREAMVLDSGMPLAQVIPFRREEWGHELAGLTDAQVKEWAKPGFASLGQLHGYRRLFHAIKVWR